MIRDIFRDRRYIERDDYPFEDDEVNKAWITWAAKEGRHDYTHSEARMFEAAFIAGRNSAKAKEEK